MKRYLNPVVCGLLVVALLTSTALADVKRTGSEPWFQQATANIGLADTLFMRAVDVHRQLLRGAARDLYDEALKQWDNPDIRWNLAIVLEDLGQYVEAHHQLEQALRWGSALGAQRLRDIHDRMAALEGQRLARIEASSDEPNAEITLDGQPWFRGPGRRSALVLPGEHYIAAHKSGFFPVTRALAVSTGKAAHIALPMDKDQLVETRHWSVWKPWALASAGVVVTAIGVGLEQQAQKHLKTAMESLSDSCPDPVGCDPTTAPAAYRRATTERRIAVGALVAGGATLAVGLTMAWLNRLQVHRTEARAMPAIEVIPVVSTEQAGISAQLRF